MGFLDGSNLSYCRDIKTKNFTNWNKWIYYYIVPHATFEYGWTGTEINGIEKATRNKTK